MSGRVKVTVCGRIPNFIVYREDGHELSMELNGGLIHWNGGRIIQDHGPVFDAGKFLQIANDFLNEVPA